MVNLTVTLRDERVVEVESNNIPDYIVIGGDVYVPSGAMPLEYILTTGTVLAPDPNSLKTKPTRREFRLGDELPNRAIVICCKPRNPRMPNGQRVVLALLGTEETGEYVVWYIDDQGNADSGSYYRDFISAVNVFAHRVSN